jgi:hypothetical protein
MVKKNPFVELFDSVIEDKEEKKIMKLIIWGKNPDEIIDEFLKIKKEGD